MITLKNKKEKLAKGLPLALKIMSLLVVMHIVGCDKCDNDTPNAESSTQNSTGQNGTAPTGGNAAGAGAPTATATPAAATSKPEPNPSFSIDVEPNIIYGTQKEAKITIQNTGDNEFNPEKHTDTFLVVSKPKITQSAGNWWIAGYKAKQLDPNIFGDYSIEGQRGAAGPTDSEFKLSDLIPGKIGPKLVTEVTFVFEGLATKHGKDKPTDAEVTLKIVRKDKDTGTLVTVSGDDAKVVWKERK